MKDVKDHQYRCAADGCEAEALVCDECRRALAFKGWDGISRHPEAGKNCQLCEAGPASWCAEHWLIEVVEWREAMRAAGHLIAPKGEWLPVP